MRHVKAAVAVAAAASSKRDGFPAAQNLGPLRCFHGNSLTLPCVWVVGVMGNETRVKWTDGDG